MKRIITVLTALAVAMGACAENIAIVGGKVFTQTEQGVLDGATVLIKDGKIESVSKGNKVPSGYTRYDASGKIVTPGFVGALTSLGLVEVGSWAGEVDASTNGAAISKTGAALDVSYAINPDSTLIDITRIEGVTSAATTIQYSDMLFHGQGAFINLDDNADIIKDKAFMVVNVDGNSANDNGGTRASLWITLEQIFAEAEQTGTVPSLTTPWFGINSREDLRALNAVVAGDIPLLIEADRASDIRQIIKLKKRHSALDVVLLHGVEAWRVADELADAGISVILDPQMNLPGNFDQLGATLANAGRLEKAGVKVAIGMETHNIRLAAQNAGNAVANGLSHTAGIASLTSVPASLFGVQDQVGSLKPGLRGDVVIWSGDPLEVTEAAEQVFVNGEAIDMTSRQTELRDRYLSLSQGDGSKTSHYIHPVN